MNLRPADWHDHLLLYQWRVDSELEADWWQGTPTTLESHNAKLRQWLASPSVQVWIAEQEVPIGHARVDSNGDLSYRIIPSHRRQGLGTELISEVMRITPHSRLKATVAASNKASCRALEKAGFVRREDFVSYRWPK